MKRHGITPETEEKLRRAVVEALERGEGVQSLVEVVLEEVGLQTRFGVDPSVRGAVGRWMADGFGNRTGGRPHSAGTDDACMRCMPGRIFVP